jgi:hypothetical protein
MDYMDRTVFDFYNVNVVVIHRGQVLKDITLHGLFGQSIGIAKINSTASQVEYQELLVRKELSRL